MRNTTRYPNRATGQDACRELLCLRPDGLPGVDARGYGTGARRVPRRHGKTVPSEFNPYDRYYEARLYQRGLLASRPTDVLALIASYRSHSPYFTDALAAQGRSVWRRSPSFTGTHTLHASAGNYLSLSLGYVRGAAISPRVKDTLTFTVNWGLYL